MMRPAILSLLFVSCIGHAQWRNDVGIILIGKVVTMNDAGEVFNHAQVLVRNGKIDAIYKAEETLPTELQAVPVVKTEGVIYPGLIDLHNHPEYAIYPLLPVSKKYRDRYEWRNYDDAYNKRIAYPQIVLNNDNYFSLSNDIGRYGEMKALLGGTTSLQGGRVANDYAKNECLVRNIETSEVTAQHTFSHVDIGRDLLEWQAMANEETRGNVVIHLAEGASSRMADELKYVKNSGLLNNKLIAIHGVGLRPQDMDELARAGAHLVWSPLSNLMLYGKTANIDAARRAGVSISLAPDWAPSGSKSVLGELKVADLVNRHELKMPFTNKELVELVTRHPAAALGWQMQLGQVRKDFLADLIVLDDRNLDPYRNLIEATEENIQLVLVRGEPLAGDVKIMQTLKPGQVEILPYFSSAKRKAIDVACPLSNAPSPSVQTTIINIQTGMKFDAAYAASHIPAEQINRDLLFCNFAKANDPPSANDAKRALACRYQLPFEKTKLSPLVMAEDAAFFPRLLKNPNLPAYLKKLPDYYRAKKPRSML